jgi:hypothetical protein
LVIAKPDDFIDRRSWRIEIQIATDDRAIFVADDRAIFAADDRAIFVGLRRKPA